MGNVVAFPLSPFDAVFFNLDIRTEETYRLAGLDSDPDPQSDILVTISFHKITNIIASRCSSFTKPSTADHLYSTVGFSGPFSIIGFAGEFKKDNAEYNKNKLTMVLTTAQLQRKALMLKKTIIMGATGCRGEVQIYSSYWNDEYMAVCIREHAREFSLADPVQVMHFYIFCSKLEKHLHGNLTKELQDWTAPDETTLQNLKWRSPNRKRSRLEFGESTGMGDRASALNHDPIGAEGTDTSQFSDVLKWRHEVASDGKEGYVA